MICVKGVITVDTDAALKALDIGSDAMTKAERDALDTDGYFVREAVFSRAECSAMTAAFDRLAAQEGDQGGHEVHVEPTARRVSNIFNKSDAFDACLEIPVLLAASRYLLGDFKVHGANLREPLKGGGHQDLHVDVPKRFPGDWWVSNAIIAFDDITPDNGPPRVVPGSHHWAPLNVPYVNQGDWEPEPLGPEDLARVPDDLSAPYPGEVKLIAPAGSVAVINSSLWHAGTVNVSGGRRRVLHLTYTRRDLPQQLVQRAHLTPALFERMSPAQRYLLDIHDEGAVDPAQLRSAKRETGANHWWS